VRGPSFKPYSKPARVSRKHSPRMTTAERPTNAHRHIWRECYEVGLNLRRGIRTTWLPISNVIGYSPQNAKSSPGTVSALVAVKLDTYPRTVLLARFPHTYAMTHAIGSIVRGRNVVCLQIVFMTTILRWRGLLEQCSVVLIPLWDYFCNTHSVALLKATLQLATDTAPIGKFE
jgi:hypothetical protein